MSEVLGTTWFCVRVQGEYGTDVGCAWCEGVCLHKGRSVIGGEWERYFKVEDIECCRSKHPREREDLSI